LHKKPVFLSVVRFCIAGMLACCPFEQTSVLAAHKETIDSAIPVLPPEDGLARFDANQRFRGKSLWSLERMIEEAIRTHPKVSGKRAAYDAGRSATSAARYQYFPAPYIEVQQNGKTGDRVGVFGVQQPLWTVGKLSANLKTAKSSEKSLKSGIEETQLSLALSVVNAYQSLLSYHYRIIAQEAGVALLEKYSASMSRRVSAGVSATIEQSLVDSRLQQSKSDLRFFQIGFQSALDQLQQYIGHSVTRDDIEYLSRVSSEPLGNLDSILASAEQRYPSLARLDFDIETARHQKSYQIAQLFPTFTLKAEYQRDLFSTTPSTNESSVYVSMVQNFGSGLSTFANIGGAQAKIEETAQLKETVKRELRVVVRNEYETCMSSFERYLLASNTVRSSGDVLASYTRMFIAGKRSWLDVLNAAREFIQNEVSRGDVLSAYWGSYYRLRLYDAGFEPFSSGVQTSGMQSEPDLQPEPVFSVRK